jgi:hypothetical protein
MSLRTKTKSLAYVRLTPETQARVRRLALELGRREFRRVAFCELAERAMRDYLDREEGTRQRVRGSVEKVLV